jgi:hypothetical protein
MAQCNALTPKVDMAEHWNKMAVSRTIEVGDQVLALTLWEVGLPMAGAIFKSPQLPVE